MQKLKVLDLFSGIGGFSLGLERTGGFETVAFCEIEPFCQKVLKKHWPEVPIYEDVRTLEHEGSVDVITGGYPCQPFSMAGIRKGKDDDRHLWPAMFDLVKKYGPSWVIGENVAGHITLGLDRVLSDLASEAYTVRVFVIPACAVDAKHRRDRTWIVAHSKSAGTRGNKNSDRTKGFRDCKEAQFESRGAIVADTISKRGRRGNGRGKNAIHVNPCRQTFGYGDNGTRWATEPGMGRVVNGLSGRLDRLKTLGNAVVPQIPEIIGEAILHSLNVQGDKNVKTD